MKYVFEDFLGFPLRKPRIKNTMLSIPSEKITFKRPHHSGVIKLVWQNPGISRSNVAKELGITKSTVSSVVTDLELDGWLRTGEGGVSLAMGRPSIPLFLNEARFVLLGAEINLSEISCVAINIDGEILARETITGDFSNATSAISSLAKCVKKLRADQTLSSRTILGLGVGIPGPVDVNRGLVLKVPSLGWENMPFLSLLQKQIPEIPEDRIFVDNDANLSVMAVYLFGSHKHDGDLLYVHMTAGIGGGLILDHRLYHGQRGFAGEWGHITVVPNGQKCLCGSLGCAETLFSLNAIQSAIQTGTGERPDLKRILELLEQQHPIVVKIIHKTAIHLGTFLGNLANIFDPKLMILGGRVAEIGDALLKPATQELERRLFGKDYRNVSVERCSFGLDSVMIGAAGFAFHNLLTSNIPD
jgi:predicted NBD/HSP70 family sugar kinase